MIKYFKHWNISKPVFTGRKESFIRLPYQDIEVQKLETFLHSGSSTAALVGEYGTGKSTILQHLYAKLPVAKFSCLFFQPFSEKSHENVLLKKITRHLKTNLEINVDEDRLIHHLTEELTKLTSQGQRLIVFLDLDSFLHKLPSCYFEAVRIADISQKLDLPLSFIFSLHKKVLLNEENMTNKLQNLAYLPLPPEADMLTYTKEKLLESNIREDLFNEDQVKEILRECSGSISQYNRVCESLLIDSAIAESEEIVVSGNFKAINSVVDSNQNNFDSQNENDSGLNVNLDPAYASEGNLIGPVEPEPSLETIPEPEETLPISILDPSADSNEIIHEEEETINSEFIAPTNLFIGSDFSEEAKSENKTNDDLTLIKKSSGNSNFNHSDSHQGVLEKGERLRIVNTSLPSKVSVHDFNLKTEPELKSIEVEVEPRKEKKIIRKTKKQLLKEKMEKHVAKNITPFSQLLKDA